MPSLYLLNVTVHILAAFISFGGMLFLSLVGAPVLRDVEPVAYWCLTSGTATRIVGELTRPVVLDVRLGWLILTGGMLQICGLAVFFYGMWPRIRAVGSRIREASGERI